MTKDRLDTLIELALIPLLPFALWLFWRLHARERESVKCDGGGQA